MYKLHAHPEKGSLQHGKTILELQRHAVTTNLSCYFILLNGSVVYSQTVDRDLPIHLRNQCE